MSVEESSNKRIKLTFDADDESVVVVTPSGSDDDAEQIQDELDKLDDKKNKIKLQGDFILGQTIYLPSNFTWILDGKITLNYDKKGKKGFKKAPVEYKGVTNSRLVAISLKVDQENVSEADVQATNITMIGGTYDGGIDPISHPVHESDISTPVRFVSLSNVTKSTFRDMIFQYSSNDAFTLHCHANNNVVRNLIARKSHQNGLADKGHHNKWFDCIVEGCRSDGWVPKSRYSEYHHCIARGNGGPGFGLYARVDGPEHSNQGAEIVGNKFYEIQSYENRRAGMSMNCADNAPESKINDNYIQGIFRDNGMFGVWVRNKDPKGELHDNQLDIISYGNKGIDVDSPEFLKVGFEAVPKKTYTGGIGVRFDGIKGGKNIQNITGTLVCYDNEGKGGDTVDLDINQGEKCSFVVFKKKGKGVKVVGSGKNGNQITEKSASGIGSIGQLLHLKSIK